MIIFSKKNKANRQSGSTLVELLLYLGIFSILTAALFQLFVVIIDTQLESQSTSSVLVDGQYVLSRFNYDIKQAKNIVSPAVGQQSPALQLLIDNTTYTYALTSGNITSASSGATIILNSNNTSISDLVFTHLEDTGDGSNDTVTVSFTLNSNISKQGGPQTESFKSTFGVRTKQ